eukprot:s3318_g5.t2
MVGADVFEYSYNDSDEKPMKIKGCVWHDRASGTASVSMMQKYSEHWEPSSAQIIRCFMQNWLQHYPRPKWLVTDAALYFVSEETNYFLGRSGVGHLVSPAEAHWVMGAEERLIQRLKYTAERLMKELSSISPEDAFRLAAHAHNSTAAGVAYRRAQASDQLSKLNNAVGRARAKYSTGELVMVWRARKSAGKGAWTGPVRVIHLDGSTLWLASAATLLRAKLNQVRPVSRTEEFCCCQRNPFAYDRRTDTKIPVEDSGDETEEISSSGSELEADEDGKPRAKRPRPAPPPDLQGFAGYAFEIEMEDKDWKAITSKPRRAHVWMSKKLQEKSKEVSWRELTLEQKHGYDEAQAKEISNVLKTMAVRALSASELKNVSYDRVMKMRWVLTTKSTGLEKARLVILGYQSPTLLSTQSSSPTLSRLGKLLLLTTVANNKWLLESADVTSAFLQSQSDLEKDDLYVSLALLLEEMARMTARSSKCSVPSTALWTVLEGGTRL